MILSFHDHLWEIIPFHQVIFFHKFMQEYKNLLKLNIPSKTISNSFLVMNRQIWTNQKRHLSMGNADEPASALCALCGEVETQCTSCLSVLGGLNLDGKLSERQLLTWWGRPPRQHKHTGFMLIVQYTIFKMDRFQGSMPVRLWHGSKKSKGTLFTADLTL